ncbi:MAG: 50S ribosomal protein L25/general stress protein Ctc [Betaproteobacteria bacterium]|nr:50S ribosomal protein L25/general stress protein Ctc [Betaproteobacteria bacterium]
MTMEITATRRGVQGKGASRRLRRAGRLPGIVYGGGVEAAVIEMDHNDIYHRLKQEAFHASILSLVVDGAKESVLLRDFQMHPYRPQILHMDFQRVAQDQKVHVKVPLHFVNADVAPGVKLAAGVVSHILNEVDISCLPKDLPEFIEVDLSNLAAGHSVHLSQLKLPAGVEISALAKGGEDLPVATIVVPRGVVAEEAGAAPAAE